MARQRASIVGAGVGGLTAALTLARKGLDVTLFERDPLPGVTDVEAAFDADSRSWDADVVIAARMAEVLADPVARSLPRAAGPSRSDLLDALTETVTPSTAGAPA